MTDAYDDIDPAGLAIESDDFHPNASGHDLLARQLDIALSELPEMARMWGPSSDHVHSRDSELLATTTRCRVQLDYLGSSGLARRSQPMTTPEIATVATDPNWMLQSLALLAVALMPWPVDWDKFRGMVDSARSPELNRAEREGYAAGYYEGLIGGNDGSDAPSGEPSLRLIGKPSGWVRFQEADVVHYLEDDFLQFELQPLVQRTLFGQPFLTNCLRHARRSRHD